MIANNANTIAVTKIHIADFTSIRKGVNIIFINEKDFFTHTSFYWNKYYYFYPLYQGTNIPQWSGSYTETTKKSASQEKNLL